MYTAKGRDDLLLYKSRVCCADQKSSVSFTPCALSAPLYVLEYSHMYRSHEGQHELPNYGLHDHGFFDVHPQWGSGGARPQDHIYLAIDAWWLSRHRHLQCPMPITVYPVIQEDEICRNVRCRLRHGIIECNQCGCYVPRKGITGHFGFRVAGARELTDMRHSSSPVSSGT